MLKVKIFTVNVEVKPKQTPQDAMDKVQDKVNQFLRKKRHREHPRVYTTSNAIVIAYVDQTEQSL